MKECWAKSYSSCDGKLSREHLLSRAIFGQKNIFVQGFNWCSGKEVEVNIDSLTSKILCQKHNNSLSEVDEGSIAAIRVLEMASEEVSRPQSLTQFSVSQLIGNIDGILFERWLLKTAINLSYNTDYFIGVGMTDATKGNPPPYLLAVVFGDLPFTHKMGLYSLIPKSEFKFRKGEIAMTPIHKNSEIGGFWFHIRGFDFFLSLFPGHAPPTMRTLDITSLPDHVLDVDPIYRIPSLLVNTSNYDLYSIFLDWSKSNLVRAKQTLRVHGSA